MFKWFTFRNKAKKEKKRIYQLREDLINMGTCPDDDDEVFQYALKFFNIVSKFQDDGKIVEIGSKEDRRKLNYTINRVGRDEFGRNRTRVGETVTLNSLYLGNVFGLWTRPASDWKRDRTIYEDFAKHWLGKERVYDQSPTMKTVIARYQLQPCVCNARTDLIDISSHILKEE